ncbi:SOS response-associated peptidase [Acetobacter sp. DsW_063]|uniref:SOS response-associated peptidase n=1 Tax=Acetobacter sp. DsW_063 TaxID=1514894 RepID=UPI000A3636F5|nr:SOS response-associated peptidase [Acetobacter sp. DsW_063]OUJ16783.1 hypothetical protein HK28_09580 [Acetobacter sp. DsW_063]
MCGRYVSVQPKENLQALFGARGSAPEWLPSWNIAPTQPAPIITAEAGGTRRLTLMRWGLVPSWATDLSLQPFNARAETVMENGTFRAAFRSRRCLVPADAYYEWARGKTPRQPWAFARPDGAPMALAGVWDMWGWDGDVLRSFAIITTPANNFGRTIHERMPVIIAPRDYTAWLTAPAKTAATLMTAPPEDALVRWAVSRRVNNALLNDVALLERHPA